VSAKAQLARIARVEQFHISRKRPRDVGMNWTLGGGGEYVSIVLPSSREQHWTKSHTRMSEG